MTEIKGKPIFDRIVMVGINVEAGMGKEEFRFAYVREKPNGMFGSTTYPGMVMSEGTRKLFDEFKASFEADVAKKLFPETDQPSGREVTDESEPAGLADEGQDSGQI